MSRRATRQPVKSGWGFEWLSSSRRNHFSARNSGAYVKRTLRRQFRRLLRRELYSED